VGQLLVGLAWNDAGIGLCLGASHQSAQPESGQSIIHYRQTSIENSSCETDTYFTLE
jgi:hypothetical protein